MSEEIDLNQDTGLELKQRCSEYIAAFDRMQKAMEDGFNVHGAMSGLIGGFHNLDDVVTRIKQPGG